MMENRPEFSRPVLFAVISIVLGCTLALSLAEVTLRVLDIGYGSAPLESDPVLHHVHPKRYSFLVHTPNGEYGGFHVYYDDEGHNVSSQQWHSSSVSGHTAQAPCRIAFLGASITEAGQVPFEESFVGLIQAKSKCEVQNFAVTSYSPIFYLTQWRSEVRAFNPTLVIVQVAASDVSTDAWYINSARLDADGLPLAIPGPPDNRVVRVLRGFYLVRLIRKAQLKAEWWLANHGKPAMVVGGYVEEDPDITPLTFKLMDALVDEVNASSARIAIFVVPSKYRLVNPDIQLVGPDTSEKWGKWAAGRNVAFVDLTRGFRECSKNGVLPFFREDVHFNSTGHKLVAAALCQRLGPDLGLGADEVANCERNFAPACAVDK